MTLKKTTDGAGALISCSRSRSRRTRGDRDRKAQLQADLEHAPGNLELRLGGVVVAAHDQVDRGAPQRAPQQTRSVLLHLDSVGKVGRVLVGAVALLTTVAVLSRGDTGLAGGCLSGPRPHQALHRTSARHHSPKISSSTGVRTSYPSFVTTTVFSTPTRPHWRDPPESPTLLQA